MAKIKRVKRSEATWRELFSPTAGSIPGGALRPAQRRIPKSSAATHITQEGVLLRRATRKSRCLLVAAVRFLSLVGSRMNLAARRPVERVPRQHGLLAQLHSLAQSTQRIAGIWTRERAIDRDDRAGIALIKQIVESQDCAPVGCLHRRGQTVLAGDAGLQV